MQAIPFGYLKPPGAQSLADVIQNPVAEATNETIFSMLECGEGHAAVTDALNAVRVPLGRLARSARRTRRMAAGIILNQMVKGVRRWNHRASGYDSRTGRRCTIKAPPAETLYRYVPHL